VCTFNGPLSGTTQVSQYQKGKTNLDFTEARDSERQWHHLGRMQTICTSLQTDNHAGIDHFASALLNLVVIGLFFSVPCQEIYLGSTSPK